MRTEKEIKERIEHLEHMAEVNTELFYRNEIPEKHFHDMCDRIWNELKFLHWVSGKSDIEAVQTIGIMFVRLADKIKAELKAE